ncbi:hypothetical protein [Pseudoroseomonas ludipueritiae]|uniref:Uncharacterized protein n=1 Tax=Pseudoroseomonas ludipueritiae TaxID=198093 RepID=A0ABR7R807_9PROT|nr:hypothetical protein [Pseudoroseomonas ludipueritiae]MBC9177816.1 hypothetical protein [Pseudoroseomonas ludipueritiae]MCG7363160.1 hypothetical protein [Roseomonas sp. ACRSG]
MAVSISVSPVARPRATEAHPSLFSFLSLAAAGMTQRWRQQTRSTIRLVRSTRAQIMAEAARREAARRRQEREKKPFASAARSHLYFLEMAAQNAALAWDARAAGDDIMSAQHQAEANWFAQEARQRATFTAIWPEV